MASVPAGTSPGSRPPLWFIFAVTVTGILANSVITPNIPDILADLGQPAGRAGLLVAVSPLPGIVLAPEVGVLADRYGRRAVLVPCLVVFGIAAALAGLAPTFSLLLAARFAQGVGGAGLINLAVVLIGDHWEGLERTRLIGRNSAVLAACLALIPSVAGVIGEAVGWRWAVATGTVGLPVAVVGLRVLAPNRPAVRRTVGEQLRGAAVVLRQPALLTVLLSGVLLFMVIFGVFLTALPVHLEAEFGLSAGPRGLILSSFAVGSTVAAANLGPMRRLLPARPLLVAACAVIALSSVGIGIAPSVSLILVAAVFYGLGDGTAIPVFQDLITTAAPTDQRASVMAAWVSGVRLRQTIGPLAAAALFAATSTTLTMLVGAALFAALGLALTIAPLAGAAATAPGPRTRYRVTPPD